MRFKNFSVTRQILWCALALGICTSALYTSHARAQSTCDPAFMETLTDKAWMEAQREIEINQDLIWKPDSVFELTCFDKALNHAASNLGPLFSEKYSPKSGSDLDNALTAAVGSALDAYINNNGFSSSLGSGRTGTSSGISGSVSGGSYNCDLMQALWKFSQCTNAQTFYYGLKLADMSGVELRQKPQACPQTAPDNATGWQDALQRIKTMQVDASNDSYFDQVSLYETVTSPDASCAPGIPTGVEIDGEAEKICPNPGCTYVEGSCER